MKKLLEVAFCILWMEVACVCLIASPFWFLVLAAMTAWSVHQKISAAYKRGQEANNRRDESSLSALLRLLPVLPGRGGQPPLQ